MAVRHTPQALAATTRLGREALIRGPDHVCDRASCNRLQEAQAKRDGQDRQPCRGGRIRRLTQIAHSPERPNCRSASCAATASGAGGDAAIVAAPFSAFNAAYCTGRASACTSGRHDTRQPYGTGRKRLSCSLCAGKPCLGEIRPPCAVWTSVHSASLRFPWCRDEETIFFPA